MKRRITGLGLAVATAAMVFVPAGTAHADPIEDIIDSIAITQCPYPTRPYLVVYVYGREVILVCK
ncbi:MAG TPA: hypothetical protein VNA20_04515 [Frankiaceae bacterium]|nr:hypothetical protein [Frankiaceae bacterium]